MKRIDTATAEADKHGPGRNGFRYGDPDVPTAPTEVDDTWLDNAQEELANLVELNGGTLDEDNHFQVPDVVLGMMRDTLSRSQGFVASGLTYTVSAGLVVTLAPGVFYANGRRYTVTPTVADDLTLADNDTRYIYIEPDPADERGFILVDNAALASGYDSALVAVITTAGGAVTNIANWSAQTSTGGRVRMNQVIAAGLLPQSNSGFLGLPSPFMGHEVTGRWANVYMSSANIGEDRPTDSADDTMAEETQTIVRQTVSGPGVDDEIIVATAGRADRDAVTIEVKTSGRRTDADNFGYTCHLTIGAHMESGAWVFNGIGTVHHEDGDGAGVRDLRVLLDASDRIILRMDIDNAEDWVFTSKVNIVWNTGV